MGLIDRVVRERIGGGSARRQRSHRSVAAVIDARRAPWWHRRRVADVGLWPLLELPV